MLLYSAFEDVRFSDRVVRVNLIAPVEWRKSYQDKVRYQSMALVLP